MLHSISRNNTATQVFKCGTTRLTSPSMLSICNQSKAAMIVKISQVLFKPFLVINTARSAGKFIEDFQGTEGSHEQS